MAAVTFYHYPKCSTCRKARRWLDERAVEVRAIDLVAVPPSVEDLASILRASGLPVAKLFNTSGVSYREGGFRDRLPRMTEAEALDALAADGKLIKRPILRIGDRVAVGYREAEYERLLADAAARRGGA